MSVSEDFSSEVSFVRCYNVKGFINGSFAVGGISFISRLYGWASDNVRNYEVRLPIQ
jgi:hypothetical protein